MLNRHELRTVVEYPATQVPVETGTVEIHVFEVQTVLECPVSDGVQRYELDSHQIVAVHERSGRVVVVIEVSTNPGGVGKIIVTVSNCNPVSCFVVIIVCSDRCLVERCVLASGQIIEIEFYELSTL